MVIQSFCPMFMPLNRLLHGNRNQYLSINQNIEVNVLLYVNVITAFTMKWFLNQKLLFAFQQKKKKRMETKLKCRLQLACHFDQSELTSDNSRNGIEKEEKNGRKSTATTSNCCRVNIVFRKSSF